MAPSATNISNLSTAPPQRQSSILHRLSTPLPKAVAADRSYVWTEDGRKLVDGVGGAAVTAVGMGHPKVVKAVQDQVAKMAYIYNAQCTNGPAEELADLLIQESNGAFAKVGFLSGGSEATEALIKLARQYFVEVGQPQRRNYIARNQSYHGNTLSVLSLSGHLYRRAMYEDILDHEHFHHVSPANARRYQRADETEEEYVARLAQELEDKFQELGPNTVIGFICEPVVGATTVVVPPPKGYLKAMKEVCDRHGALFMLDEVMSGMGRMGTLHAWQTYDGVSPELQAVAKGLGGGYAAIGAIFLSKRIWDGISGGTGLWVHGHTYQANPVACAASLAVQKVIKEENLFENIRKQGEYIRSLLEQRLRGSGAVAAPYIYDIRGKGGFWGVEFDIPPEKDFGQNPKLTKRFGALLQARTMDNGLICISMDGVADGVGGSAAMLAPAYNVTKEEVEEIVELFVKSIEELIVELLE